MFYKLIKMAGFGSLVFGFFLSIPVPAEEDGFSYEEGSVWVVTFVKTKTGKFDQYIEDLAGHWRARREFQMEKGDVLSYKVMYLPWPRDNEPSLLLMIEYRNFAAFDNETDYWAEMTAATEGSVEVAHQSFIERGELRTLRGSFVAREITFRNED